jgi:hypothetical protein
VEENRRRKEEESTRRRELAKEQKANGSAVEQGTDDFEEFDAEDDAMQVVGDAYHCASHHH